MKSYFMMDVVLVDRFRAIRLGSRRYSEWNMSRMCPVFNSGSEATESLLEEFHKLICEWDTASASGPSTSRAEGDDVDARLKPLLDKLEAAVAGCVSCPVPDGGEPSKERLEPLSSLASAVTFSSSLAPSSPASTPSTSACSRVAELEQSSRQVQPAPRFCCPACRGVLTGAVILPCGDAFCKRCVRRDVPAIRHRLCTFAKLDVASWTRDPHSSVTVVGVVEKLWADDLKSVELRTKGNTFCEGQNYVQALDCYRSAEKLLRKKGEELNAVDLGALLSNVSFVLQMLRRTREAAEEAEKAVQLRPSWSKARYRLACAFMRLDQWEDAFKALVMTAVLEKSIVNLRKDFAVVFSKLLLQEIAVLGKDRRKRLPSDEAELPRAKRREVGFNSLWKACLLEVAHLRDTALVEAEKEGKYFMLPPENRKDGTGVDVSDVECALCLRIFWEPVTTPCGHTFCRSCLYQALDSSSACPLCKGSLHLVLANRVGSVTKILEAVCRLYFPEELEERRLSYVSHLGAVTGRGDEKRLPLFVCGVALPSLPCPLHVYEPRYRLMIRRCMESGTRQFGVCAGAPNGDGVSEFGTIMEIRDVHYFPDGRSVLETIGSKRFKILRVHQVDGYYLGDIELVHDEVPTKEAQISCLTSLMTTTRSTAARWFQSEVKDKTAIFCELGPMPKEEEEAWKTHDGPAWVWWFLRVLPISPTLQLKFLSMMSLEKRLHGIEQIIQCVTRDRSTVESIPEDRR